MGWNGSTREVLKTAKSSQLRFFFPIFSHEYKMSFLFICVEMVVILLQRKPHLPTTGNVDCHPTTPQSADHRVTNKMTPAMADLSLELYHIRQPAGLLCPREYPA
jgi:hypothetical protein